MVVGEGVSPEQLSGALRGRSICDVHRKGKQLWLELGGKGPHLLLQRLQRKKISEQVKKAFAEQAAEDALGT